MKYFALVFLCHVEYKIVPYRYAISLSDLCPLYGRETLYSCQHCVFFLDVLKEKVIEWAVVNITALYTEKFIVSFTQ